MGEKLKLNFEIKIELSEKENLAVIHIVSKDQRIGNPKTILVVIAHLQKIVFLRLVIRKPLLKKNIEKRL